MQLCCSGEKFSGDFDSKVDLASRIDFYSKSVDAISCLTEVDYFKGSIEYLKQIKQLTSLPILRKDFMIDRNYKKVDSCFNEDTMFDENCSYDNCEKDNQRCIKLSYVKGLEKKKKHIYTIE